MTYNDLIANLQPIARQSSYSWQVHTQKQDGYYHVDYKDINAGFIVKDHQVVQCAPVLRSKITMWLKFAKLMI